MKFGVLACHYTCNLYCSYWTVNVLKVYCQTDLLSILPIFVVFSICRRCSRGGNRSPPPPTRVPINVYLMHTVMPCNTVSAWSCNTLSIQTCSALKAGTAWQIQCVQLMQWQRHQLQLLDEWHYNCFLALVCLCILQQRADVLGFGITLTDVVAAHAEAVWEIYIWAVIVAVDEEEVGGRTFWLWIWQRILQVHLHDWCSGSTSAHVHYLWFLLG